MTAQITDELGFRQRATGRFRHAVSVRYEDLDTNAHVNHAKYLAYLEEARLAFRKQLIDPVVPPERFAWPIAHLSIDYMRSAEYPMSLDVEMAALRVGSTSLTLGYGIFAGDTCLCAAMTRSVCIEKGVGKPSKFPAELAAILMPVPSEGAVSA